jgi:hypothetical protein
LEERESSGEMKPGKGFIDMDEEEVLRYDLFKSLATTVFPKESSSRITVVAHQRVEGDSSKAARLLENEF